MNPESKKILLIVNPASGRGKSIDMLPEVEKEFTRIGVQTDIRITDNPEQVSQISFMASRYGYHKIAAMGGDGTVNMVASGLLESDSVMSVIPAGTGNDFFKMLGIENNIPNICRSAIFGKETDLDVGMINNQPFFNMLGIGFDAEVAKEANQSSKNLGLLTYLISVYHVWKKFPTYNIKLRIDNLVFYDRILLVAVGIGRSTGGGFKLTPYAIADDGKFDVCVVKKTSRRRVFSILPRVLKGTHISQPETRIYRCRQLEISSRSALPVHYEGETFVSDNGQLSIKQNPNKLRVTTGIIKENE